MRQRKKESGQALVEFALVIPLLLLLVFGSVEFGRVFHASHVITSAAREGARAAAVGKPNDTPYDNSIEKRVDEAIVSLISDSGNVVLKTNSTATNNTDPYDDTDPDENHVFFTIEPYELFDRIGSVDPPIPPAETVDVKVKGAVKIIVPLISSFFSENPKIIESQAQMRME